MIYPKSFALSKRTVDVDSCFMLMPFHQNFNSIYGHVKNFLKGMGIECIRADNIFDSGPILSTVVEQILRSEFIVADLTTRNANVFYEIGLAHSFRDSDRVILIAQSMEDVPFDIRHLPVIIYQQDNLFLLEEGLKNRIKNSREKLGYKRFLLDHFGGIEIPFPIVEKAIDNIKDRNPQFVEIIHSILSEVDNGTIDSFTELEIRKTVESIDSFGVLANGLTRKLLYKMKLDVLSVIARKESFSDYCLSFLKDSSRDVLDFSFRDDLMFSSELACRLIDDNVHKSIAINWLLGYLLNSRVGGIDIIRNKIDEYLVSSKNEDIDRTLINGIKSENATLREAVIDILSQKRNQNSYSYIISSLGEEKNIYVVRSIINGLARFNNPSSMEIVNLWFMENENKLKAPETRFLIDAGIDFFKKFNGFHYSEKLVQLKIKLS